MFSANNVHFGTSQNFSEQLKEKGNWNIVSVQ